MNSRVYPKGNPMHRLVRKLVTVYKKGEQKLLYKSLRKIGTGSSVAYPFIIKHPDRISIGENTVILSNCNIGVWAENAPDAGYITIGDRCTLNENETIQAGADIIIGDDVIMAAGCSIFSDNHGYNPDDPTPYYDQPLLLKKTVIGDGCWLGHGVIVLAGVTIGKRCVIGGGAVVTHDIPSYSIAVGNPARVVKRYDFEEHEWKKV